MRLHISASIPVICHLSLLCITEPLARSSDPCLQSYLTHLLCHLKPDPLLHSSTHTHTPSQHCTVCVYSGYTYTYILQPLMVYVCVCLLFLCISFAMHFAAFYLLFHTGCMLHTFCIATSVCVSACVSVYGVCVCVYAFCIYACSNLFIVCIFVFIVYRTLNKLPLLLLQLQLDAATKKNLHFFRHFLLGVGRFIDWFSSVLWRLFHFIPQSPTPRPRTSSPMQFQLCTHK